MEGVLAPSDEPVAELPAADRLAVAPRYVRMILGVIGIHGVTVVANGNAKSVDMGEQTMDGFVGATAPEIRTAAP